MRISIDSKSPVGWAKVRSSRRAHADAPGFKRRLKNWDGQDLASLNVDTKVQYDLISFPILKGDVVYWKRQGDARGFGDFKDTRSAFL
jgi:hypothetical protein